MPVPVPKQVPVKAPTPAPRPAPIPAPASRPIVKPAAPKSAPRVAEKPSSVTKLENVIADGITESPEVDKAENKFDDYANGFDRFDPDDTTSKPKLRSFAQSFAEDIAINSNTDSVITKMMKSADSQPSVDPNVKTPEKKPVYPKTVDPNFSK